MTLPYVLTEMEEYYYVSLVKDYVFQRKRKYYDLADDLRNILKQWSTKYSNLDYEQMVNSGQYFWSHWFETSEHLHLRLKARKSKMNYRIAKKILHCKSSLMNDPVKVFKAKLVMLAWPKYKSFMYLDEVIMVSKRRKGLKK